MTDPPKMILCLPLGLSVGGIVTWGFNVAAQCVADGHPAVLAVHGQASGLDLRSPPGVSVVHLPGPHANIALRWHIRGIARALAELAPAVVIPNGGHAAYAACALLKRRGVDVRVIGIAHADEAVYFECLSYYAPVIDRFVGVSENTRGQIQAAVPRARAADIFCEPYGVPVPDLEARRRAAGDSPLELLYAGRLIEHQKHVSRLVDLVIELRRRHVPFRLHIAGEGPARPAMERALCPGPGREDVFFHGVLAMDAAAALFSRCDVLVLVSDFEGTSLSMLEAMARGVVPAVSRVSGVEGVVQDGENGLIHTVGDIATLAGQIAKLAADRPQLRALGDAARETIIRERTIAVNAARISAICADAWDRPHPFDGLGRPLVQRTLERRLFWVRSTGWLRTKLGLAKEHGTARPDR